MLDRLRHATEVTKFKADQLLRVNRVQGDIGNIRREVQLTRDRLAGAVLERHRAGPLPYAEVEQLCAAIDRLNAQIMEREAMIAAIQTEPPPVAAVPMVAYNATSPSPARPTQPCPHCGFGVPVQAAFCPNCGRALPKPNEPSAPQTPSNPQPPPESDGPAVGGTVSASDEPMDQDQGG